MQASAEEPAQEGHRCGLREALFPACDPCEEQRRRPEKDELQRDPQQRPQQQPRPIHTRGSVAERVAAVVIAKGEGGADAHADPTRSSFTLWELRKDGPRNECDYRVYLDERYRSQPYVMEKVPCVSKDSEIDILGRRYAVHLPDAPGTRPPCERPRTSPPSRRGRTSSA